MAFLKDGDREAVRKAFENNMEGQVSIIHFTDSKENCEYCDETLALLKEVQALDSRIKLVEYDIKSHSAEAKFLGVDSAPATIIGGKRVYGVIFQGIPAGYEFSSLIGDIVDASKGSTDLPESIKNALKGLSKHIDIKVFVTPTCPYCPKAVRTAHKFAIESKYVHSSMIEAGEFMSTAEKYGVMGVPKVVINDKYSFEGAQPEDVFMSYVLEAAK
ncbi:thioredoxin family protein [Candidatus Marsarchaeota archaeon]|nr:thioredoxin family protein [Candidatus Marsarchaeota archaeon]MCL5404998.1 thioredoxin family protein [Candidatus Marsarchaeota archaeon]